MSEPLILVEKLTDPAKVALIRFNRPKVMNALNDALCRELEVVLRELDEDPNVHVIVVTGNEKAFAAGADIAAMAEFTYAHVYNENYITKYWEAAKSTRKPIIAAVAGYALGGGCEFAMMCDFIIAADNAKFGQPEITIGTIPGMGGTQRLPRSVGKAKAMEWCLTGKFITAQEAEVAGLVSRIVPADKLMEEVLATAGKIASYSLPAVLKVKETINAAFDTTLAQGLQFERREFHGTFALEDQKEGMRAFVEKRKPNFKNK
ncbi:MAG: enoyl-CoA hydratase [Casimicrobium sp.]